MYFDRNFGKVAAGAMAIALLGLSACAPTESGYFKTVNPVAPVKDTCGAATYANLVGQSVSVLAGMTIPDPKRVIEAGSAVTMDYNEQRLNIRLDVENNIAGITCG